MSSSLRKLAKRALGVRTWNSDDDQERLFPDAQTIIDVGANVGQTAKTYRALFPQAEIWSFEPFPKVFETLRTAVTDSRFHPQPIALSDEIGTTRFNVGAVTITNSMLRRETDTGTSIEVKTDTLDRFCAEHGISNIDILKVDVEGAESRVFRGAENLFARGAVRAVFVEVYFKPVYQGMPLFWELHAMLSQRGFSLYGLYSLIPTHDGSLSFGNALYLHGIAPQA